MRFLSRITILSYFFVACAVLAINMLIVHTGENLIATSTNEVPHAQAALILGARILGKNTVSSILADRLDAGIALYKAEKVDKLLISGDHGQPDYDEVNVMRRYLLAARIPPEDIFMDHAGFDTYDSVYRARDIFHVDSVIIVSQRFHLYRALFIAEKLGMSATGIDATQRVYDDKTEIRNALREMFARVKAFFDVNFHSSPTYLGTPMPITGDGRMTIDE